MSFSDPEATAPLTVGGLELEVGALAGTRVSPAPGVTPTAEPDLARALEEVEQATADEETTLGMAVSASVDEAAEVTSRVERATELFEMLAKDRTLDPMQFRPEIDSLLDRLAELDRSGRLAEALRLARALEKLLALIQRWEALGQTLTTALRAGRVLKNQDAIAWVRHELGTLELAAGDPAAADRNLSAARDLRERLGDRAGLRVTEGNLQSLCHELRQQVRDERLVRPSGRGLRPVPVALVVAAALVLLLAGGVAGAMIGGDDDGPTVTDAAETDGTTTTGPASEHGLEVEAGPGGSVESSSGGIACPTESCSARFKDGARVTLAATADPGFELERWGGACEGQSGLACRLTLSSDLAAKATFVEAQPATATLTVTVTAANLRVDSDPEGFACLKRCTLPFTVGSTVTLIATRLGDPAPTAPIAWGGACEETSGDSPTCDVLLDADKSVSVDYQDVVDTTTDSTPGSIP